MTGAELVRFTSRYTVDAETGCWVFGSVYPTTGYGRFYVNPTIKQQLAHRVAYEHFVGPIGDGMVIDHLCRNRACANPLHLEVVTRRENNLRGEGWSGRNARKTHCRNGHPYAEHGVTYNDRGYRRCQICHQAERKRAWTKANNKRKRAQV